MGYQALLFCPDEKTARLVTQVLTELDFNVDPCNEPFAAVKKLTTQHYDAVVVDCDNEQNAGLLFKSARNSASNQSSLAVAVVEGQAGVAKAFRIGANLVLTKPINVDQAKGTLRVARGLLKKTEPGKAPAAASAPAASVPAAPAAQPMKAAPVAPAAPAARTFTPAAPKTTFAPPVPKAPAAPAMAASASTEVEDETIAEAAIDEDMSVAPEAPPTAPTRKIVPPAPASRTKEYPWQPASKPAGAMASSLKRAADVVGQAPAETSESEDSTADYAAPEAHSVAPSAAAAAPTRAKIPPRPVAKPVQPAARVEAKPKSAPVPTKLSITDPLAEEGIQEHAHAHTPVAPPKLASAPSGSGSKIGLIAAVAVLVLAAAGYFGWTKFHSHTVAGTQVASQVATETPAQVAPVAPASSGAAETKETKPAASEAKHSAETSASANSAPAHTEKAQAQKTEPEKTATKSKPADEQKSDEKETASEPSPILVKNGGGAKAAAAPVQAPIQAPSPDALLASSGGGAKAISGIVDSVGVVVPKAQTLKISQAVMQSMIIKKVQPQYPYEAQRARLHGTVQLEATISKDGHVANVKQLSGSEVLGHAAMDAVRQWRYKPYMLDGQPIEVQTQVSLDFKLP